MMLPHRHLLTISLTACALAVWAPTTPAASAQRVPACDKAAPAAQATLVDHNKHCAAPTPPPPPPPPPPPACDPSAPSDVPTTRQAGPYSVTKTAATSLTVTKPDGGLNAATEFDAIMNDSGYGFPNGASVPWFQLYWSDTEVRVENWQFFDGLTITAVQFYQYPYPGPLFGGWNQLDRPLVMGEPRTDCVAS